MGAYHPKETREKRLETENCERGCRNVRKAYFAPKTVKLSWGKYLDTESINNDWDLSRRPRILTNMEEKELVEHCRENRHEPARQYRKDLNLMLAERPSTDVS